MTETDQHRAALMEMCRERKPSVEDRALANVALNRAMAHFMQRKGHPANGPYDIDDLGRVMGPGSSVMSLIVEAEIAIAASRLLERERCAKIAEQIDSWSMSPKEVAAKIRSGE